MPQNVIKPEEAEALIKDAKNFNFASIEASARELVARARTEAEALINRARSEVDKLRADVRKQEFESARREGYDKGYEEGLAKGQQEGQQQAYDQHLQELQGKTSTVANAVQAIASELDTRRKALIEQAEQDMLSLSFAIAEKITRETFACSPNAVRNVVRNAIDLVLTRTSVDVFANPDDIVPIDEYLPELRKVFTDLGAVQLHPDPALERGSVVVKAGRGEVALKLNEQLDAIVKDVLGLSASQVRALNNGS
ncbi:MAG: hypothetical protein L6Q71_03715 [Planctomycetes bacterium]|nr:hypothetical protein [Planctomycetota bacterium]NUQ35458.1 hypothetical protein [Planctomycetaceae bacterium]